MRTKQITKAVDRVINRIKKDHEKFNAEMGFENDNPVADVRVNIHKDHIQVTYDGQGYEYFSYNAEYNLAEKYRNLLTKELEKMGLYFEDANNWSLTIYDN